MDYVLREAGLEGGGGGGRNLGNLHSADDATLIAEKAQDLQALVLKLTSVVKAWD